MCRCVNQTLLPHANDSVGLPKLDNDQTTVYVPIPKQVS